MSKLSKDSMLFTLPAVLKEDEATAALGNITAAILEKRLEELKAVQIYQNIDKLPEQLLDILAYDFKVDWWNPNAPIAEKQNTLKDSWNTHRRLGTAGAVRRVAEHAYGIGAVQEWFAYGGQPYHFKLCVGNIGISEGELQRFLKDIERVKNVRSILDAIVFVDKKIIQTKIGVVPRQGERVGLQKVICKGYAQHTIDVGLIERQAVRVTFTEILCDIHEQNHSYLACVNRQGEKITVKQV